MSAYIDVTTLRLADGACEKLAARCELLRSELAGAVARLDMFAPVNHAIFGDCEEGRGWNRVLHDIAWAPTGSLTATLEEHGCLLTEFADTFRRIGDAYLDTDRGSADRATEVGRQR
ncbi:hypothetical protein FZI91_13550 [Mycobacterium sp. CBMA271]|uniref:hypothetical protein n=1 Tax=unclassified Mycobacteroides TaxID=2618759 RepID=UPI0012DC18FF|nr:MULTISPECIES: hypothetical protein [unclassified Mycobacteroides]MUM18758.1 hypothetical protein [Mycobacteroides sp. CBMA 326]MUM22721.1 hypothetical protein [Mycobacteroides sp. CBMA 271]